jgi:predicted outer membrane repeat protein
MTHANVRVPFRVTPLAACLAVGFALGQADARADVVAGVADAIGGAGGNERTPAAWRAAAHAHRFSAPSSLPAATPGPDVPVLQVANCNDDGSPGTLRSVVTGAPSGAIVDLSQLACSTISLANGAIAVAADSLHLVGPASGQLTLNANQSYRRILDHTGTGTLSVKNLRIAYGWAGIGSAAYGGCIRSAGSVELDHVAVIGCKAVSNTAPAKGGGIYTAGDLTLRHSTVSGNDTNPGTDGFGGGAFAGGSLGVYYSTISDNYSLNLSTGGGYGGGLFATGNVNIVGSTIARNHAVNVGGISIAGFAAAADIINSTISGNLASNYIGGVYSNTPLHVSNSTLAFNSAAHQSSTFVTAAGLQVYATSVDLQSSIVSNNMVASFAFDLGEQNGAISGAHNLIRTSSDLMPVGTITDDPQLLTLQDNGGETATLALAASSPAVDQGSNTSPLSSDQRGAGYPRVIGAAADIGAFERQSSGDLIFRNGFDGDM